MVRHEVEWRRGIKASPGGEPNNPRRVWDPAGTVRGRLATVLGEQRRAQSWEAGAALGQAEAHPLPGPTRGHALKGE